MKHESLPRSPGTGAQANGPHWTTRKMTDFLRHLATTHSVKEAAQAVGMSRQSAYKLRSRLKGKAFDAAWDQAFRHSYENLPFAALERALNGVEVPHYYKGELVGTSRRYDERLTVALLRMINSGPVLLLHSEVPDAESHGSRLETLLRAIETDGEDARDPHSPECSAAVSAAVSPWSDEKIMAGLRELEE